MNNLYNGISCENCANYLVNIDETYGFAPHK